MAEGQQPFPTKKYNSELKEFDSAPNAAYQPR